MKSWLEASHHSNTARIAYSFAPKATKQTVIINVWQLLCLENSSCGCDNVFKVSICKKINTTKHQIKPRRRVTEAFIGSFWLK